MFNKNEGSLKEELVKEKDKNRELMLQIIRFEEDKDREIKNLQKDFESKTRIKNEEIQTKISEGLRDLEKEKSKLEAENVSLKKEIEILNKAFENMGFDVKDMKDILDQLVKGIIAKNEIKVIK